MNVLCIDVAAHLSMCVCPLLLMQQIHNKLKYWSMSNNGQAQRQMSSHIYATN